MYLNRIELIGFTGKRPESKSTPTGKDVTNFSLATKETWMQDGERKERTEWHDIVAWGKLGEYAAGFKKGSHLHIEGSIRTREYTQKDGTKVSTYEVVASSILNLRTDQRVNNDDDSE